MGGAVPQGVRCGRSSVTKLQKDYRKKYECKKYDAKYQPAHADIFVATNLDIFPTCRMLHDVPLMLQLATPKLPRCVAPDCNANN